MKKLVFLIFIVLMSSCKKTETKNKSTDCARTIHSENSSLCLPTYQGLKECYLELNIKKVVNNRIPESSLGIGFYLNDESYKAFKAENKNFFGDYLLLFTTEALKNRNITYEEFTDLASFNQLTKDDWNTINKILIKEANDLSFDKPVIIGTYSLEENHSSTIILSKYRSKNQDFYRLTISNCYFIKNKIIFSTYNDEYTDREQVKEIKKKNDYLALRFLQDNE